jgi:arginyl-tRNA synthetase
LLAVGFSKFGSEEALSKDPIRHLFDVYVNINKLAESDETIHDHARSYFKRMEQGKMLGLLLKPGYREGDWLTYAKL